MFRNASQRCSQVSRNLIAPTSPLMQLGLAYAYGTPDKMKPEESGRRSLVFIGGERSALENDPWPSRRLPPNRAQQPRQLEAAPPSGSFRVSTGS